MRAWLLIFIPVLAWLFAYIAISIIVISTPLFLLPHNIFLTISLIIFFAAFFFISHVSFSADLWISVVVMMLLPWVVFFRVGSAVQRVSSLQWSSIVFEGWLAWPLVSLIFRWMRYVFIPRSRMGSMSVTVANIIPFTFRMSF